MDSPELQTPVKQHSPVLLAGARFVRMPVVQLFIGSMLLGLLLTLVILGIDKLADVLGHPINLQGTRGMMTFPGIRPVSAYAWTWLFNFLVVLAFSANARRKEIRFAVWIGSVSIFLAFLLLTL